MPINSRAKGASGEREFANWLKERGIEARRGQQFSGSPDSPDVKSELPVHWEVKRVERFNAYEALEQAIRDAGQEMPIVSHRRNHKQWICILRADDLLRLLKRFYGSKGRQEKTSSG